MSEDRPIRDLRSVFGRSEEEASQEDPTPQAPGEPVADAGPADDRPAPGDRAVPAWPQWAVVDWDALERRSGDGAATAHGLVPPTVSPPREPIRRPEPPPRREPEPQLEPEPGPAPEIRPTPVAEVVTPRSDQSPGTGLSLTPDKLWELVQEAAMAAQEARERAARAEGEAQVLRAELERERAERERLTASVARRRWFRRKPKPEAELE